MITEEEIDAEYRKYKGQHQALIELHDEIGSLLNARQLCKETVDSKTVIGWLMLLHNTVQDGLQRPRYSFPENEVAP